MKKIFLTIPLLLVMVLGCNKLNDIFYSEQSAENQLKEKIHGVALKYKRSHETVLNERTVGTFYGFFTDVFAGCGAASLGVATGPGAVAFGVAVGTYFSAMCGIESGHTTEDDCTSQNVYIVFPSANNVNYNPVLNQSYWTSYSSTNYGFQANDNYYDHSGLFHNVLLKEVSCTSLSGLSNSDLFDSISVRIARVAIADTAMGLDLTLLGTYKSLVLSVADSYSDVDFSNETYKEDFINIFVENELYVDNVISNVFVEYLEVVEGIGIYDIEGFDQFHTEFEHVIMSSSISQNTKKTMMSLCSLAKFSYLYWNSIK